MSSVVFMSLLLGLPCGCLQGSILALKRLKVLQPAPDTLARPVELIDRLASTPDKSMTFDGAVDKDNAGAYLLLCTVGIAANKLNAADAHVLPQAPAMRLRWVAALQRIRG